MTIPKPLVPVPSNVSFAFADVNKTLPFPDDHFDLVFVRIVILGVSFSSSDLGGLPDHC